jgi:hypothetical protein
VKATINQINKELREIATAHVQLNSYFFGDFLDIYESDQVQQTSLLANINTAPIDEAFITLNIELIVMDKVDDGKENAIDVESDTLQILNDIYQVMKTSNRWQKLGRIDVVLNANKFTERGGSVVNGWFATIPFKVKKDKRGTCDLPLLNYSYE